MTETAGLERVARCEGMMTMIQDGVAEFLAGLNDGR